MTQEQKEKFGNALLQTRNKVEGIRRCAKGERGEFHGYHFKHIK